MSRLEELIRELCPYGVEFTQLSKVIISLNTGLNPRQFFALNTDDANNYYVTIRELQNNRVKISEKTDRINDEALRLCNNRSNLAEGDVLFSGTGTIGETAIIDEPPRSWNIKEGVYAIKPKRSEIFPRFLMYLLMSEGVKNQYMQKAAGGTVKSVPMGEMRKLRIPLPPLPVQREIVRILDNFTQLTARKKQYEYYRSQLLNFDTDVPVVQLGEIGVNLDSKRKPVTKGRRESGKYPYYGASGIVDYVSDYIFDGDYLLISEDGANLVARATPIAFSASGKIWVNNHAHVLKFETYTERKYVEYYLNMIDLSRFISTAAQPKLTQENLNKIPIPVPHIKEQERIVTMLDRFDSLINDISSGLPGEIEARRKQYEYYRDQLLTFKEEVYE